MKDDKAFETMADKRHSGVVVDLVGEVLQRRGRVCLTIASGSMMPSLRLGDRAEVERIEGDGPRIGDLLLIRDPVLGHVIHRLLWRRSLRGSLRECYTKGDAARYRDRRVEADRVLGRVIRVVRGAAVIVERPFERRIRWVRSVAGMVAHGAFGRWSKHSPAGAEQSEDLLAAGADEDVAGGVAGVRRDAPRRRL